MTWIFHRWPRKWGEIKVIWTRVSTWTDHIRRILKFRTIFYGHPNLNGDYPFCSRHIVATNIMIYGRWHVYTQQSNDLNRLLVTDIISNYLTLENWKPYFDPFQIHVLNLTFDPVSYCTQTLVLSENPEEWIKIRFHALFSQNLMKL